tara:strand:- start:127 stop:399 length:273 start_codon:yes stop_codon:yes gene_type:complete
MKIDVSEGKSKKANRLRAMIGYSSLIIASLTIYFLGSLVVGFYGFELQTRIRDVDLSSASLVFISMLPIVALVIWATLATVRWMFKILNI